MTFSASSTSFLARKAEAQPSSPDDATERNRSFASCCFILRQRRWSGQGGPTRSNSVPKGMLPIYERIVGLTDDVCDRQLNSEYRDLARAMTGALCRKRPSPLTSGQPRTWAGGIVYVLGRINFLGDRSFPPYMTTADLCAAFGVGESTVHAKARVIEKTLRTGAFDPKWALPSLVDSNPLVWMAEVNGLLVDLRTMPREVQEVAFAKGIIPYIPADGQDRS
jgi:hypothetical protein